MKQRYKLISMTLIFSTNAVATIPLVIPPYVIFEHIVNTQKQAHRLCLDKANHEKEIKDCDIMNQDDYQKLVVDIKSSMVDE